MDETGVSFRRNPNKPADEEEPPVPAPLVPGLEPKSDDEETDTNRQPIRELSAISTEASSRRQTLRRNSEESDDDTSLLSHDSDDAPLIP